MATDIEYRRFVTTNATGRVVAVGCAAEADGIELDVVSIRLAEQPGATAADAEAVLRPRAVRRLAALSLWDTLPAETRWRLRADPHLWDYRDVVDFALAEQDAGRLTRPGTANAPLEEHQRC